MHPPPSPARSSFTLMTECTPESSGCYSVYSVVSLEGVGVLSPVGDYILQEFNTLYLTRFRAYKIG